MGKGQVNDKIARDGGRRCCGLLLPKADAQPVIQPRGHQKGLMLWPSTDRASRRQALPLGLGPKAPAGVCAPPLPLGLFWSPRCNQVLLPLSGAQFLSWLHVWAVCFAFVVEASPLGLQEGGWAKKTISQLSYRGKLFEPSTCQAGSARRSRPIRTGPDRYALPKVPGVQMRCLCLQV